MFGSEPARRRRWSFGRGKSPSWRRAEAWAISPDKHDFCARKAGLEIIERPGVVGLKPQIGLDVVEGQGVGRRQRPDEFTLAQNQSLDLQLAVQQGRIIQPQLNLPERERRAVGSSARPMRTWSATSPRRRLRRKRANSSSMPRARSVSTSGRFRKSGRPTRLSQPNGADQNEHEREGAGGGNGGTASGTSARSQFGCAYQGASGAPEWRDNSRRTDKAPAEKQKPTVRRPASRRPARFACRRCQNPRCVSRRF